jgi:nucleoside-diphosphate-sugar epimerase
VRLLVTGAAGFVGTQLVRLAAESEKGMEVVGVRRPGSGDSAPEVAGVEWVSADLTAGGFDRALPDRVDAVLHLAQSSGYRNFPDQAEDVAKVNILATAALLEYARRHGAGRFVLASTATLYRRSKQPLTEDFPLDTSSLYAASKRSAELLLEPYTDFFSCRAPRIFTCYGAGQRGRLIAELIERVRAGEQVYVEGRHGVGLSPIHVSDLCSALLAVCSSEPEDASVPDTLNVGGAEEIGILEIVEAIGSELGREPQIAFEGEEDPPGWIADRSKLTRMFPSLPAPLSFAEGIRRTLELETAAT